MIKTAKLKIAFQLLAFYAVLLANYIFIILPKYEYMGFISNHSTVSIITGLIVLLSSIFLVALIKNNFLFSIGSLILITFTIPYIIIYQFSFANNQILIAQFLFIGIFFLGSEINLLRRNKTLKILNHKFSFSVMFILTGIMMIPFVLKYYNNINMSTLWFNGIYSTRAAFKAKANLLTGYSFSWLARVILPVLMVYGLKTKKNTYLIIAILGLLFLYVISGHKSVFIGSIIVVLFYYGTFFHKIFYFLVLVNSVLLLALLSYFLIDNIFLSSLLARRAFLLPSLLNEYYFQYFINTPIYWSNSILSFASEYPFQTTPAHLIGEAYLNSEEIAANNGLISDGFMNAKFIGVILNILLFTWYFKIIESLKVEPVYFGIFFFMLINIMSSSFTIVMLTHGGIFLLLILVSFNFTKQDGATKTI